MYGLRGGVCVCVHTRADMHTHVYARTRMHASARIYNPVWSLVSFLLLYTTATTYLLLLNTRVWSLVSLLLLQHLPM